MNSPIKGTKPRVTLHSNKPNITPAPIPCLGRIWAEAKRRIRYVSNLQNL